MVFKKNKRNNNLNIDELRKSKGQDIDKLRKTKGKMPTYKFYVELLFSLIAKGNIDKPDDKTKIPEGSFYYATNKIFTSNKVMKVLFIQEFPMYIDSDIFKDLRRDVEHLGDLNIVESIEGYDFNRDSWKVKNRIAMWKNRAKNYQDKLNETSNIDEIFGDTDSKITDERTERMIRSWDWVNKAESGKLHFCKYSVALELIADNLELLYEMEDIVIKRLRYLDIFYKNIFVQTNEYYKVFSPCGGQDSNLLTKLNNDIILTDYELSEFFYSDYGLVGDGEGVYFGTDVFTGNVIQYNLKKGTDAVNLLLTATAGEGKSNYSKGLITYFKLNNLASVIVDYEGDEYIDVGIAHGAKFINMNPDVSYYFDTTEIGDLTGDEHIDKSLKDDAIMTTKLVFDVLTDYNKGMNSNEVSLFNDMILRVYKRRGVTDDPNTWSKSKGASYEEVYRELSKMKIEEAYKDKQKEIDEFDTKLRLYFDGNIYSNMFKNRISINEILGHELVIFSFGMRGSSENTIDRRSLALRQLFVGYLTQLICNYNKTVLKRKTVITLEELQRYLTHEASGKIVNNLITGGRKRGVITILISNSPLQMVDSIDALGNSELANHAKAIKNNITGFIVGRLQDETSKKLVEVYPQLKNCLDELLLINQDDNFKYSFLLNFRGENSVVKFEIPPSLVKSKMYATNVEQKI